VQVKRGRQRVGENLAWKRRGHLKDEIAHRLRQRDLKHARLMLEFDQLSVLVCTDVDIGGKRESDAL
jgi:hypothetical protein